MCSPYVSHLMKREPKCREPNKKKEMGKEMETFRKALKSYPYKVLRDIPISNQNAFSPLYTTGRPIEERATHHFTKFVTKIAPPLTHHFTTSFSIPFPSLPFPSLHFTLQKPNLQIFYFIFLG